MYTRQAKPDAESKQPKPFVVNTDPVWRKKEIKVQPDFSDESTEYLEDATGSDQRV